MSDNGQESGVVQPAPLPFTQQFFGGTAPDGSKVVHLVFHTPQGSTNIFIPQENAEWLRDQLVKFLSGLEIARNLPPRP